MGEKALQVNQGHDWLTYRSAVAQMFDTLDRLREMCHSASMGEDAVIMGGMPIMPTIPMPRYEIREENQPDFFTSVADLCDDLSAELDAVLADLFLPLQKEPAHRWMGFEIRLHINQMRSLVSTDQQEFEAAAHASDNILALVSRIRDLLIKIDQ